MYRIAILAFIAACSTSQPHDVMLVDAAPDAPDAPIDAPTGGPNVVELFAFGSTTPDLLVYRDGNGAWLKPDPIGNGKYDLHVTDAYEVVAVCTATGLNGSFDAEELAATFGDGAQQFIFCGYNGSVTTVAVTGMMAQAGMVSMYDTKTSTTGPWTFDLAVPTGTHELVATAGGKMVLRRNVAIAGAMTVPSIDVAATGTAMGSATLTITGKQPGDTVESMLDIFTGNDDAILSDTTNGTIVLPPASLLQGSDSVGLVIDDHDAAQTTDRSIYTFDYDGTTTAFTLPPAVSGITYATSNGALNASWASLPTYTGIDLYLLAASPTVSQQHVNASKSWVDATGATSMTFDTSAPGYLTGWTIDLAAPYTRGFGADDVETTADYRSDVFESVNGATAQLSPHRSLPRFALAAHARR